MLHNYSAYVSEDHRKKNYMSRNVTVSCIGVPQFGLLHIANVHLSWAHHGFYEEYLPSKTDPFTQPFRRERRFNGRRFQRACRRTCL